MYIQSIEYTLLRSMILRWIVMLSLHIKYTICVGVYYMHSSIAFRGAPVNRLAPWAMLCVLLLSTKNWSETMDFYTVLMQLYEVIAIFATSHDSTYF